MVEHHADGCGLFDHVRHGAKLLPRTCIQDQQDFNAGQLLGLDVDPQGLQLPRGIDKLQIRRRGLTVDNDDVLAKRLQHSGHAQFASQGIAVGSDVAGQQESPMRGDNLAESLPVDAVRNRSGRSGRCRTHRDPLLINSLN